MKHKLENLLSFFETNKTNINIVNDSIFITSSLSEEEENIFNDLGISLINERKGVSFNKYEVPNLYFYDSISSFTYSSNFRTTMNYIIVEENLLYMPDYTSNDKYFSEVFINLEYTQKILDLLEENIVSYHDECMLKFVILDRESVENIICGYYENKQEFITSISNLEPLYETLKIAFQNMRFTYKFCELLIKKCENIDNEEARIFTALLDLYELTHESLVLSETEFDKSIFINKTKFEDSEDNLTKFKLENPDLKFHNHNYEELSEMLDFRNGELPPASFKNKKIDILDVLKNSIYTKQYNSIILNRYCEAIIKDKYQIDFTKIDRGTKLWSYNFFSISDKLGRQFAFSGHCLKENNNSLSVLVFPLSLTSHTILSKDLNDTEGTIKLNNTSFVLQADMRAYLWDVFLFCHENDLYTR